MITTVTVNIKETTDAGEDLWKLGKFNLVDLAGSENVTKCAIRSTQQGENLPGVVNDLLSLGRNDNCYIAIIDIMRIDNCYLILFFIPVS